MFTVGAGDVTAKDGATATREKVCLLPRLSLSELIHVAGLVRRVCAQAVEVMLVTHRDNAIAARRLFGDTARLRFVFVEDWKALHGGDGVLERMESAGFEIVPLRSYREVCPYAMVGLPATAALIDVHRNSAAERQLLQRVRDEVGPVYVVVHDTRGRRIRPLTLPPRLPVVRTDDPRFRTDTPFDWLAVMDHAMQLHAIDSAFLMLAHVLSLRTRKFCHAYASNRAGTPFRASVYSDAIVVWD